MWEKIAKRLESDYFSVAKAGAKRIGKKSTIFHCKSWEKPFFS